MKKVGRVGARALIYFEIVSTVALLIGLAVVNTLRPGACAWLKVDLGLISCVGTANSTSGAPSPA